MTRAPRHDQDITDEEFALLLEHGWQFIFGDYNRMAWIDPHSGYHYSFESALRVLAFRRLRAIEERDRGAA